MVLVVENIASQVTAQISLEDVDEDESKEWEPAFNAADRPNEKVRRIFCGFENQK